MSTNNSDDLDLSILMLFAKVRRKLNLKYSQAVKHLGIGPKQAAILRELIVLKSASHNEIALLTQTDPAETGKVIETLIKKRWVKRTDHPQDRRRWQVSLTDTGTNAAQKIHEIHRRLAKEFCKPLTTRGKESFLQQLSILHSHVEVCRENEDDRS
jgi:DNA-binding MarR family transcriptional regulator